MGAGVADFPRYNNQVECVGVNVATSATVEEYALLRDQLWFGLQKWLKDGGTIPADPKLEAELVAPTYAFDLRGCADRLTARMPLRLPSAHFGREDSGP